MPLMSGGELVLADATPGTFSFVRYPSTGLNLTSQFASYGAIYKAQLWVHVLVRKRALATRRLPFKVYARSDSGRVDRRDSMYGRLMREPNPRMSGEFLWEWTSSTYDVYGEAIWLKVRTRDRDRTPGQLWPIHPSNIAVRDEVDAQNQPTGRLEYIYSPGLALGTDPQLVIPERDVVHFKTYNPDTTTRGLSPLEPLRQTLVNEDAARRASSAFWKNGARPSGYLSHPNTLSQAAADRLKAQWDSIHAGVDNYGKWAVLEEGMEPKTLSLTAEEAQYIESRRLNREEACAVYDTPPPVVHILDRATFCLPADALVSTARGPVRIVDVAVGDDVWSLVDGELRTRKVTQSGQTGFKSLLTIRTQNRTLRCTDNHPVLVRRAVQINETPHANRRRYRHEHQWVPAGDLRVGDIIVTATELPEHGDDECPTRTVSEGFAEFCGLLLADGWINRGVGVTIARATNAAYMDHYRAVMRAEFRQRDGEIMLQEQERMTRFSSASAAQELAALGLSGTAHTKTVPAWVFGLNSKLRAAFVRGFLDGDGSVDKKGRMSFSSCNPTMLRQVRELCIGLGVPVTNLYHRVGSTTMPNGRRAPVDQWSFTCSDPGRNATIGSNDPRYVERFAAGQPFATGKLSSYYRYADRTGRATDPPVGCGHAKVVRIDRGEIAVPVYDLTVDGSHNFIAEGVVVHNSNITEQMRSMYRDTMAPHLGGFEATLELQLRPDFGDASLYGEFLMDEVLRGAFEQRVNAYQAGVNSGWLKPSEVRELENLPFVEGSDRLFVNSTMVPLEQADRALAPPATTQASVQTLNTVMGRLGSCSSVDEIDPATLTAGLNGHSDLVVSLLDEARADGVTIGEFRARVRDVLS